MKEELKPSEEIVLKNGAMTEIIGTNPNLEELKGLLGSDAFRSQYLAIQSKQDVDNVERVLAELKKAVDARLKPAIEAVAMQAVGVTSVEDARKLGKQWGDSLKAVSTVEIEIAGVKTLVDLDTARKVITEELSKTPDHVKSIGLAKQSLEETQKVLKENLARILEDSNSENTKLIAALDVWGRSPNAKGDFGIDGKGFNAGVIHYFEYRADPAKNGRFKDAGPSVDGFIIATDKQKGYLGNPNPVSNPNIQTARLLEDNDGNRRLLILTKENELTVAFQRVGEPMRVITNVPGQTMKELEKRAQEELAPKQDSKKRLNMLNGAAHELPL